MVKENKEYLNTDLLFQQQDLKRNDSIFSLADQFPLEDDAKTVCATAKAATTKPELSVLNENFIELNSNKHSFEKLMRKNIYELFRCFLFVYLIYYRTSILVPNSYYHAETRLFLKAYFTDHFKLEDSKQPTANETLLQIIDNTIFQRFLQDNELFSNYVFLGDKTIKIKFHLKEITYSCASEHEIKKFPYNQICANIDLNLEKMKNESNKTCPELNYVYGAESFITDDNRNKGLFSRVWDYFNKFECKDAIDDTQYEENCDGYLIEGHFK